MRTNTNALKWNLLIFGFLNLFNCLGQSKHSFSLEGGIFNAHYTMDSLDHYLSDTTAFPVKLYGNNHSSRITSAPGFFLSLNYQPFEYIDLGITFVQQSSNIERSFVDSYSDPFISYYHEGMASMEIQSYTIGLISNLHISTMCHMEQYSSKLFQRLNLGIGLSMGTAFNRFQQGSGLYNNPSNVGVFLYKRYSSIHLRTALELKLGYQWLEREFFSEIGLKLGYQHFSFATSKDEFKNPLKYGSANFRTLQLDFSGFYYGIYLKIGK